MDEIKKSDLVRIKGTEGKAIGHVIDVISHTAIVQLNGLGMQSFDIAKLERVMRIDEC